MYPYDFESAFNNLTNAEFRLWLEELGYDYETYRRVTNGHGEIADSFG